MGQETDIAYTAGIIDGEGHVTISKCIRSKMNHPSYGVYVSVSNTNYDLIAHLERIWQGFGSVCYRERDDENHSPEYIWTMYGKVARSFLDRIKPFLTIKLEQAELCIALQDEIDKSNINSNNAKIREDLYQKVRALNKRGE